MRLNREKLVVLVAIVYARVSKDDSRRARSVAEQIDGTRADLADEGVSVGVGPGGSELVFTDNDIGASRHTRRKVRPDFDRMRSQITPGRVVAVWEPSRLSRNTTEFMLLLDQCAAVGVPIFYGGTFYDMNDPDDRYRVEQDALDGQREAGRTRKRVLRSVNANAAAGNPHGRPPFGYEIVWEQGRSVARRPHPTDAAYVVGMVERLLAGETYYGIAKWLTGQQVPVPARDDALPCRRRDCQGPVQRDGRRADRRTCGCPPDWATRWSPAMVKATVGRASYAGLREHHRNGELLGVVEGTWPALISVEDHERVKQIVEAARPVPRGNKPKHLLSGLMICGQCGQPMYYRGPRKGQKARYACGLNQCTSRVAGSLEEWVEANVVARLESEDLRALLETSDAEAAAAHAEARVLRREFKTWIRQALAAKLPPADIAAYRELHEPALVEAEASAALRLPHKHVADAAGPDARRRWLTKWSIEEKRDIIASMVSIRVNRHVHAKGVFSRRGIDPATIEIRRLI